MNWGLASARASDDHRPSHWAARSEAAEILVSSRRVRVCTVCEDIEEAPSSIGRSRGVGFSELAVEPIRMDPSEMLLRLLFGHPGTAA